VERVRRLRYGHVLKLIRFRYGAAGVPDDEAGRPDLMELIWLASSAPAPWADKKVRNCIELYALWMDEEEKRDLLELVAMTPTYEKAKTSQELGDKLLLSNADRERLKLYSIRPCDLTPEQFERQSKERKKASRTSQRRRDGVRTREEYLAECRNKPKPWLTEGISRRQWQRKQDACRKVATDMSPGEGPTILCKQLPDLATSELGGSQRRGLQGSGATGRPVDVGASEQAEKHGSSQAVSPHHATSADDERLIAMNNWGKNAEQKNRPSSKPKKPWSKPMFSEELRDFTEFPLEANELAIKEAS
jgi:hypothetical protein